MLAHQGVGASTYSPISRVIMIFNFDCSRSRKEDGFLSTVVLDLWSLLLTGITIGLLEASLDTRDPSGLRDASDDYPNMLV